MLTQADSFAKNMSAHQGSALFKEKDEEAERDIAGGEIKVLSNNTKRDIHT